eukprot:g52387.t1
MVSSVSVHILALVFALAHPQMWGAGQSLHPVPSFPRAERDIKVSITPIWIHAADQTAAKAMRSSQLMASKRSPALPGDSRRRRCSGSCPTRLCSRLIQPQLIISAVRPGRSLVCVSAAQSCHCLSSRGSASSILFSPGGITDPSRRVAVTLADAEGDTQGNHPPKDLSSVFEEIAQKAQEQFELGGGEQTPKRPPISIPSDSELVSVLDDARDNRMCDMHKNRDYYYLTCRVPKPRKESQLLGEAHGFTDAEVEEFTLQYMNLSEQLVFKPGDDKQAKIATQTLMHMNCNVMSDQQVTNLLRASQHPWLTGAKLVKQRKELKCFALDQKRELVKGFQHSTTQEGIFPLLTCKCKEDLVELKQYAGEVLKTFESWEKDGWTSSATAPGRWQRIQSFWKAWWQQFRKTNTPTPFEPAAALLWQSQTRKVFRDATSPAVQPEQPKIVSGEWKVEMEGDPYSFICWARRPQDKDGRHPAVTRPDGSILRAKDMRPRLCT